MDNLPFFCHQRAIRTTTARKTKSRAGIFDPGTAPHTRDLQLLAVPYFVFVSLIMTEDVKYVQMTFARVQTSAPG